MKEENFYKEKVVLVTGSTMGIGKEVARQLLLLGSKVVITGRTMERLEKVEHEFSEWKENILILQSDVCRYSDNEEMIGKVIQKFERLDIVITNAGLSCYGEVDVMKADVAKEVIDTNIYGSLYPVKAAIPELKKTKGSVLLVSSIAGFHGLPGYSAYSLSKMALKALAQSLSLELNESKVSVGIAFVGFTENEKDKKTLAPNGEWQEVPKRSSYLTVSRTTTAIKLLNQIQGKKFSKTHSFVGKFTELMIRFFPTLPSKIFKWNYIRRN